MAVTKKMRCKMLIAKYTPIMIFRDLAVGHSIPP